MKIILALRLLKIPCCSIRNDAKNYIVEVLIFRPDKLNKISLVYNFKGLEKAHKKNVVNNIERKFSANIFSKN